MTTFHNTKASKVCTYATYSCLQKLIVGFCFQENCFFRHKKDQNRSRNGQNLYHFQNVRQHWHACTSTYSACTSAELCQNKYQSQPFANVQTANNCPLFRDNKWLDDKICMDSTQKEGFFHSSIAVFTSLTFQGQICRVKFSKCVRTSTCTVDI